MDPASTLREARRRAGLSQTELATRAGTSQATISAYETGRKQPSVSTLGRLLAATGTRLTTERVGQVVIWPSERSLERVARTLHDVLGLAAALPTRHERELVYPRLVP